MDISLIIAIAAISLIVIFSLWYYKLRPYFARDVVNQKLIGHPDRKRMKSIEQWLIKLYKNINAFNISIAERKRLGIEDDSFTYGEIEFLSFLLILSKVESQPGDIFYDLGSGSGKAVLTAALYYDLSKAYGIELLPNLCKLANRQIKQAKTLLKTQNKSFADTYLPKLSIIEFINENILHCDISDGDIFFINATCMRYSLWDEIVEKLNQTKPGSRIIVVSKTIKNNRFKLLYQGLELMGWGYSSLSIYIKIGQN